VATPNATAAKTSHVLIEDMLILGRIDAMRFSSLSRSVSFKDFTSECSRRKLDQGPTLPVTLVATRGLDHCAKRLGVRRVAQ
jgi:hypothetical protein